MHIYLQPRQARSCNLHTRKDFQEDPKSKHNMYNNLQHPQERTSVV